MAIRQAILKKAEKTKAEKETFELQKQVSLTEEWEDKCPDCKGPVALVWTSPDGTAKAWKCKKGHSDRGRRVYPVWLVRS